MQLGGLDVLQKTLLTESVKEVSEKANEMIETYFIDENDQDGER